MPMSPSALRKFNHESAGSLLQSRNVLVFGEITSETSELFIAQMLPLAHDNPDGQITVNISSPGGSVHASLAMIDAARTCGCPIKTVGHGLVASAAALLFACAGDKGSRVLMPHSSVMIHQVLGGMQGRETDLRIAAERVRKVRETTDEMLAVATGRPREEVNEATEVDMWMTPEEAVDFGIADSILTY